MEEQLWFTDILNRHFAGVANTVRNAFHLPAADQLHPIANSFAMELLVVAFLLVLFVLIRSTLSVEKPGQLQHFAELFHEFVNDQNHEIIGPGGEQFTPFIAALLIFILVSNLIGVIPGFEAPTASPIVPLGCALFTFVYYHLWGIRKQGIGRYIMHFAGPQDPGIPLFIRIGVGLMLFPIEIISHCARILSLSIRLYANMFAGDMVTLAFFALVPIAIPAVFLGLHIGVSLIQAYIFALLASVYLAGAVVEEH